MWACMQTSAHVISLSNKRRVIPSEVSAVTGAALIGVRPLWCLQHPDLKVLHYIKFSYRHHFFLINIENILALCLFSVSILPSFHHTTSLISLWIHVKLIWLLQVSCRAVISDSSSKPGTDLHTVLIVGLWNEISQHDSRCSERWESHQAFMWGSAVPPRPLKSSDTL